MSIEISPLLTTWPVT